MRTHPTRIPRPSEDGPRTCDSPAQKPGHRHNSPSTTQLTPASSSQSDSDQQGRAHRPDTGSLHRVPSGQSASLSQVRPHTIPSTQTSPSSQGQALVHWNGALSGLGQALTGKQNRSRAQSSSLSHTAPVSARHDRMRAARARMTGRMPRMVSRMSSDRYQGLWAIDRRADMTGDRPPSFSEISPSPAPSDSPCLSFFALEAGAGLV